MPECPRCRFVGGNVHEVRQHRHDVHGEFSPNRTCKGCQSDFYDAKSQRTFCFNCNANAGKHNGNWKDAKEEASCTLCNGIFEYYPSDKQGVYCPTCVAEADGLLPNDPNRSSVKIPTSCESCDAPLEVFPSRYHRVSRGVFCDHACYGQWLSDHIVGENHHQWDGGSIPYGETWWSVRRRALDRDQYRCRACGVTAATLGRAPDVHHITRVRDFEDPADAHVLENVISLCRPCHRKVENSADPLHCLSNLIQ